MDQDFLLIRKMKSGDEAAMDFFVRKYYSRIYSYCICHSYDKQQAEDLTQETFFRFFRALAGYRHQGKALNFLYTTARNLCIDLGRKEREIVTDSLPERGEEGTLDAENRLVIEKALGRLPDQQREIIILRFFWQLEIKEIAGILGIGISAVKYQLKKGLGNMEGLLGKEEDY